jgi:S1-C subfamily serine protease
MNASLDGGALNVSGIGDGYGPSDQTSFYAKDIPVLHFFTDQHEDYHRATDDVEKINAAGEARVVDLAYRVVTNLANRQSRLTFVRLAAPPQRMGGPQGSQTYLGSVPDMSATDVVGMRLMGVRPDSPADKGGLKTGDVIVEFGGVPVKDLYSYTDALYSHKPGDVVKVVVMRGTQRVELSVTLGKRGG